MEKCRIYRREKKKKFNAFAPANQGSYPSHLCHCSGKPDSTKSEAVSSSIWP